VKIRSSNLSTGRTDGLDHTSTGLIVSTIADNEATATAYTVAGSTIEAISTLGTYAAPTATKCRFKQVDSTNHHGIYELQFADTRYAVSNAKSLLVSISGATNAAECDVCIPLVDLDPYGTSIEALALKLLKYFQLALRKDSAIATDNATELTAINANGGSGAGGYANSSDSQEGIRDSTLAASLADKTGMKLASDGLDAIAVTAPTGVATTFPGMMVQLWRRFFKKVVVSTTEIKTYADDATTVVTTQTRTETATTQTQGSAT
jgi:hypothetical protein